MCAFPCFCKKLHPSHTFSVAHNCLRYNLYFVDVYTAEYSGFQLGTTVLMLTKEGKRSIFKNYYF